MRACVSARERSVRRSFRLQRMDACPLKKNFGRTGKKSRCSGPAEMSINAVSAAAILTGEMPPATDGYFRVQWTVSEQSVNSQ